MDEVSGLSFSADARKGKKGRHDPSERGFFGALFGGRTRGACTWTSTRA